MRSLCARSRLQRVGGVRGSPAPESRVSELVLHQFCVLITPVEERRHLPQIQARITGKEDLPGRGHQRRIKLASNRRQQAQHLPLVSRCPSKLTPGLLKAHSSEKLFTPLFYSLIMAKAPGLETSFPSCSLLDMVAQTVTGETNSLPQEAAQECGQDCETWYPKAQRKGPGEDVA